MRTLINDKWRFAEFPTGTSPEEVFHHLEDDAAGSIFHPVAIPHDWMITDVEHLYRASVGAYVRTLNPDTSRHNSVFFEGVYMRTTIYLNGQEIFFWPYGYTSFEVDLTPYQKEGENELLVYVDYRYPNTRWYSGAGIFRDVWMLSKDQVRIPEGGVYVHTEESSSTEEASSPENIGFRITIDTEVASSLPDANGCVVLHTLRNPEGEIVASSHSPQALVAALANEADPLPGPGPSHTTCPAVNTQVLTIGDPIRWDIEAPYLYTLETELRYQGATTDTVTQKIGLRTIAFSPEKGFFLNGRHVKLHGACMHHDLGALGAAFNKKAARRQLEKLKKIGVNSVRTSHNPPAVGLMELADEMGILINSDAFDMWEMPKTEYDYGIFFHDWCERDVEAWIRRDRNHPSVILWSCGNEIPDTNNLSAVAIAERLVAAVRRHDPRHNAYNTIASNYVAWENAQKTQDVFEVSGYNYLESVYDDHHERFPHWCIYGSETASTVQSRGIYHFPKSNRLLTYEDRQCSSLDNCSTNWGARSVHRFITDDRDRPFCAGQYIWTGWDYIGEPTPYFSKNSFFGHIDTAGFFKDTAYIIKAGWVPCASDPFVHISPYWDFNEGQMIDVDVYSNAPRVALFFIPDDGKKTIAGCIPSGKGSVVESYVNRVSAASPEKEEAALPEKIGEKMLDQAQDPDFSAHFRLPYHPGILRAEAYDANGRIIATEETISFGNPAAIRLAAEYDSIQAEGEDLQFIQISVTDAKENEVRNARNRVQVSVTGPAVLVGLDNGDSTDYDEYKCSSRKLFSGKLLAILAATREPGEVTVHVTSEGLTPGTLTFPSLPAEPRPGSAPVASVADLHGKEGTTPSDVSSLPEVPIRKLTLSCTPSSLVGSALTPEQPAAELTVTVEPANATYSDIHFKAVTADGIESRAVKIELLPAVSEDDDVKNNTQIGTDNGGRRNAQNDARSNAQKDTQMNGQIGPQNNAKTESQDEAHTAGTHPGDINRKDAGCPVIRARMTAISDGEFRLVASANNGKDHPEILSDLEFSATGFGAATLDPYTMVYGCEFAESTRESLLSFRGSVNFGDGNVIRFDNVDFGDYGSDELHLSLFSFRNEEPVEIWDGEPDTSELLFSGIYSVPSNYNVLQEDTFRLKKRLRGIRSLTFRFEHGFVLGGFRMTRQEKAYGLLHATEHGMITGDTFEEREDGIYGIGNNVDIEFPGMNFRDGISGITITGRARKAMNPIHIRFFSGDTVVKQVVEFPASEEMQTLTFPIEGFRGEGKVNFIFLPGSDFDLKSFRFHA